jgi:hypothetical protein
VPHNPSEPPSGEIQSVQISDNTPDLPFETGELRAGLDAFLDRIVDDAILGSLKVGNFRWGVYAFFDYDNEPSMSDKPRKHCGLASSGI